MRTFTAHLFASADGAVDSPDLFQFDSFDDECGHAMGAALMGSDATILGRRLYDEWSNYFPGASDPFADGSPAAVFRRASGASSAAPSTSAHAEPIAGSSRSGSFFAFFPFVEKKPPLVHYLNCHTLPNFSA